MGKYVEQSILMLSIGSVVTGTGIVGLGGNFHGDNLVVSLGTSL